MSAPNPDWLRLLAADADEDERAERMERADRLAEYAPASHPPVDNTTENTP